MALQEFSTNAQALTWIFLYGFWSLFLFLTYAMKGDKGRTIGFLNILQCIFGIVIGLNFVDYSFMIGFATMMIAVGTLVGKFVYERHG